MPRHTFDPARFDVHDNTPAVRAHAERVGNTAAFWDAFDAGFGHGPLAGRTGNPFKDDPFFNPFAEGGTFDRTAPPARGKYSMQEERGRSSPEVELLETFPRAAIGEGPQPAPLPPTSLRERDTYSLREERGLSWPEEDLLPARLTLLLNAAADDTPALAIAPDSQVQTTPKPRSPLGWLIDNLGL